MIEEEKAQIIKIRNQFVETSEKIKAKLAGFEPVSIQEKLTMMHLTRTIHNALEAYLSSIWSFNSKYEDENKDG